jgi:hypothetical protein
MHYIRKTAIFPIALLSFFILYIQTAQGFDFSLKTAQQMYKPGDTILITADVYNSHDQTVNIVLECLLTSQTKKRPDTITPKFVTLAPGESSPVTLFEIYVTQDFIADRYRAVVNLTINGIVAEEREITFLVQDTLKEMEFVVHLCEDMECKHEPMVFIKEKNIYIRYETPIDGVHVEGELYFPDTSTSFVVLPIEFWAEETGSYALRVTASKEGFKSETLEKHFAIIAKEASLSKEVEIDIKPGSEPNSINLNSKGKLPVSILTTEEFDASTVDPGTVTFAEALPVRWTVEDVDGDGYIDLLFHFETQELRLDHDSTEATLNGITYDGQIIEGTDIVNIVPNHK